MNYVIIKAGGTGKRMQPTDRPKQFLEVLNKPIIIHTLEKFQNHPNIEAICISCIRGWVDYLWEHIDKFKITKVKWIVEGGESAQDSIQNGIIAISGICNEDDIIIIHDAVRPMISEGIITQALNCALQNGNAVVAADCIESMIWSDDRITAVKNYVNKKLFRAQAPQCYRWETLYWAYQEAERLNIFDSISTDNLFLRLSIPIFIINGGQHNFKITTKSDVEMFEALAYYEYIKRGEGNGTRF